MLSQSSKWTQLVANLVERTRRGELHWVDVGVPEELASRRMAEPVESMFETVVDDSPIRLVEYRYKATEDEGQSWYWENALRLEILNDSRKVTFTVPTREGLFDLKEAVTETLINASGLLRRMGIG